MKSHLPLSIEHYPLNEKYSILSLKNLCMMDFLDRVRSEDITSAIIYWIEEDHDYETKLVRPIKAYEFKNYLLAADAMIVTIECFLNNRILITSNLDDEIKCRIPATENIARIVSLLHHERIASIDLKVNCDKTEDLFVTMRKD